MARRIFISFNHKDKLKAGGFNLLKWNKNVEVDFVGRHLLSPVDSESPDYITRKIKEEMKGTSATVVLIGKHTSESEWQEKEINWSVEKGNGILGIRLEPDAEVPKALRDCGAEVIDWDVKQFGDALERAVAATATISANKNTADANAACRRS